MWRFWVDRGGTFTDVVARAPDGKLHILKLLSEDPLRYQDATVEAVRQLTGINSGPLPPAELRIGTTVATNALLERKGEPVLLAITKGFGDALKIGTQERPELFARQIVLPDPLYADMIEIDERVRADGTVERPLDHRQACIALQAAFDTGFRAIAIILMHGWLHRTHEQGLAKIAAKIGFTQISVSHEVAPLIKLIARGDTTVADANLSPVLGRYVKGLEAGLGAAVTTLFMQSNGGLVPGRALKGKDAILSGPAGGIVGMATTAREAGLDHIIGFDMGGTSTDVSHYAGAFERETEARIAGIRIRAPMMRIHTVAAGGGSICRFDGARFLVGPESAGAVPGPACYRRGGPLTVTDCNLLLGKIQPRHFPHIFGEAGNRPLDEEVVRSKFSTLVAEVKAATGQLLSAEEAAEGFLAIAVANMAHAIKTISVQRGHNVTRAALVCFGGAAGQHACLVADALGIDQVMIHPLAGVLSAYGMGLADRRVMSEVTLGLAIDDPALGEMVAAQSDEGIAALRAQGVDDAGIEVCVTLHVRPHGTENVVEVPFGPVEHMCQSFHQGWRTRFGYTAEGPLIAEMMRVEAATVADGERAAIVDLPEDSAGPIESVPLCGSSGQHYAPLYRRETLAAGFQADGPALIVDPVSTIIVEPCWRVQVDALGNLMLTRTMPRAAGAASTDCDPVRLEIMGAMFMAVAEEMGAALQHSASSVNIRERLDFSCAVFDAQGSLIANAPHMPVHLGSMGESVRTIVKRRGVAADGRGILPGDVYMLNAPYDGGTHLPDITVIMPVFAGEDDIAPSWYVAARGHHADIGGISPGSMPPDSQSIEEEGVLLDNVLLVDQGILREGEVRALLTKGRWPSRNPDQNIADLRAQIAACVRGAAELRRLANEQGRDTVDAYMRHVQDHAEAAVRALISRLSDGEFRCEMDNGAVIIVRVSLDRTSNSATIDFTGTSPQLSGNFNAPLPVVRAAILYVVRTLIDDAVPMNEGCLRPITLIVPKGSMLDPKPPAAVVAGNVETSQAITDALFGALGAMAAAQGTMNNFTFGNDRHQYYETIAGGSGAGPDFDGASVVQTHMTNSRLTDPEIFETRFPVLLEEFAIRNGSGGGGAHQGGHGAIRRVRFLEAMEVGILSNRRRVAPFGLAGGEDGALGINRIIRVDGGVEILEATASAKINPGDVFSIETPGGGGYGRPS